jgi:hypothetical protein
MPSRTANPRSPQPEGVTQSAVETTGAQMHESEPPRRLKQTSQRGDVKGKSYEYASALWKRLVENLGEPEAKRIMHHLMGGKKPGRPKTDQDVALIMIMYSYILHFGLRKSDGEIARHVFETGPHYLELKSGAVIVSNSDYTEEFLRLADDPVVGRKPVVMSLAAIRKRVERLRRWSIEEGLLPRTYAPRPYYRG